MSSMLNQHAGVISATSLLATAASFIYLNSLVRGVIERVDKIEGSVSKIETDTLNTVRLTNQLIDSSAQTSGRLALLTADVMAVADEIGDANKDFTLPSEEQHTGRRRGQSSSRQSSSRQQSPITYPDRRGSHRAPLHSPSQFPKTDFDALEQQMSRD